MDIFLHKAWRIDGSRLTFQIPEKRWEFIGKLDFRGLQKTICSKSNLCFVGIYFAGNKHIQKKQSSKVPNLSGIWWLICVITSRVWNMKRGLKPLSKIIPGLWRCFWRNVSFRGCLWRVHPTLSLSQSHAREGDCEPGRVPQSKLPKFTNFWSGFLFVATKSWVGVRVAVEKNTTKAQKKVDPSSILWPGWSSLSMKGPDIWVFPKIGVPQNGWFIMENPIKMDDLGVPLFVETPICFFVYCLRCNDTVTFDQPWLIIWQKTVDHCPNLVSESLSHPGYSEA